MSSRLVRAPVTTQVLEDLPGSVPELKDERPCPVIHNTQFDPYEDNTAGQTSRSNKYTHTRMHAIIITFKDKLPNSELSFDNFSSNDF